LQRLVFLIDVDNTLLDNDRVQHDLRMELRHRLGADECELYWAHFEALRTELGYADYLGSLQRMRQSGVNEQQLQDISAFLLAYPFADRVYDGARAALQHLRRWGRNVILSDGDIVFQPHKIRTSRLHHDVDGRVLIYIHKEQMLDHIEQIYPAQHYVMIDDKLRILSAMKQIWGDRLTTIFVRQGHYGLDHKANAAYPPADISLEHIGELIEYQPPLGI